MFLVDGMCIQSTFQRTFPQLKWILLLKIPSGSAAPFLSFSFCCPLVEKSENVIVTCASCVCACHSFLFSSSLRFTSTFRVGFTALLRCCWACRMTWLQTCGPQAVSWWRCTRANRSSAAPMRYGSGISHTMTVQSVCDVFL